MQKILNKIKNIYYSGNLPKYALILFLSLGVIIALLYIIYRLIFSVEIQLTVAPTSAEIRINDKVITKQQLRVAPGEYKINIKKDGFYEFDKNHQAKFGEKIKIVIALDEINPNGDYYQNNQADAAIKQLSSDVQFEYNKEVFFKKYPITKIIPKTIAKYTENYGEYIEYRLDYKTPNLDKDNKLTVIITESDYSCNNKNDALQYIKDSGYNPDDYIIQYKCEPKNQAHP